jgi:hypothetical protein
MKLTVVFRDAGPLIFCNDVCSYRSVQIELTPDQCDALAPRCIGTNGGVKLYEDISRAFIEPNDEKGGGQ